MQNLSASETLQSQSLSHLTFFYAYVLLVVHRMQKFWGLEVYTGVCGYAPKEYNRLTDAPKYG